MKPVFAIDVGGVLASKRHNGEPVEGSLEAIKALSQDYDLWIVSMCGKARARGTKKWLHEHGFDLYIPETKQVYIRFEEENKNRVLKEIDAKYFVDDRMRHIGPATQLNLVGCYLFDHIMNWDRIREVIHK